MSKKRGRPRLGTKCEIPDCPKDYYSRAMCKAHYAVWLRDPNRAMPTKPVLPPRSKRVRGVCGEDGCNNPNYARKMCRNCYYAIYYPTTRTDSCSFDSCTGIVWNLSLGLCQNHYARHNSGLPLEVNGTHWSRRTRTLYFAYYPEYEVLKVGLETSPHRSQKWVDHGAVILCTVSLREFGEESESLALYASERPVLNLIRKRGYGEVTERAYKWIVPDNDGRTEASIVPTGDVDALISDALRECIDELRDIVEVVRVGAVSDLRMSPLACA